MGERERRASIPLREDHQSQCFSANGNYVLSCLTCDAIDLIRVSKGVCAVKRTLSPTHQLLVPRLVCVFLLLAQGSSAGLKWSVYAGLLWHGSEGCS